MTTKKPTPIQSQFSLFELPDTPDAFRKPVQVVHSKPKKPLSLVQRKIGNAWLKHSLATNPDADGWWVIGIKQLAQDIGFDSNNRQHMREAAEALMTIVFEWDVVAPVGKRALWKASVLFPEVELHSDVVKYQFSSQMRERVLNPDMYALIDMNIVRKFRRASSLAIWEHCIRYEKIGKTADVELSLFRDMILGEDANSKTYDEYKFFKSKVLKPAIAEINACSEHNIELRENKVGRRVVSLRFAIQRKMPEPKPESGELLELLGELVRIGVPQSEARKIVKTNPSAEVKAAVQYTKSRLSDRKLPKLERPAAYFRNALVNRYGVKESTDEKSTSVKLKIDIKAEFEAKRLVEADAYFQEIDPEDQTSLIDRYNEQQLAPKLRLEKKPSKLALSAFFRWLAVETWGDPTPEELLEFAQTLLGESNKIS